MADLTPDPSRARLVVIVGPRRSGRHAWAAVQLTGLGRPVVHIDIAVANSAAAVAVACEDAVALGAVLELDEIHYLTRAGEPVLVDALAAAPAGTIWVGYTTDLAKVPATVTAVAIVVRFGRRGPLP